MRISLTKLCSYVSILLVNFAIAYPTQANLTTDVESHINIINQEFSTINTTASPTDNSLGIIHWQDDKYNDESVYFEALIYCSSCSGGNLQARADLYTTAGSAVTGSAITSTQSSYTLVRSGDISSNLTNNTDYTIRLQLDAVSGTAYIKAARLVVVQTGTSITDFMNHVEIGTNDTTTSTSYVLPQDPKIYLYDQDTQSDKQAVYFEAALQSSAVSGTSYASLSSSSNCSSTVTGSEVTVVGTSWARSRSADIASNLVDDTEYWVCIKSSTGDTASISRASLIVEQQNATNIGDLEPTFPIINALSTDSDSIYTGQSYVITYTPSNFNADVITAYSQATLNAASGTAYARIYDVDNTAVISSSEVNTTNTSYTRSISADISGSLPSTEVDLESQIRNSGLNLTSVSSTMLIMHLHQIPDPDFSFSISAVSSGNTSNGITTTVGSAIDSLDFGNVTFNQPQYIAHDLTVSSNSANGYIVTMELTSFLQGEYPANNIDPFPGTWGAPVSWTEPTGSTPNTDTAWIGANTSDSRVSGWNAATEKFGPVNSSANQVMYAPGTDVSGTTATITYVLEANMFHPADYYVGTLNYVALPTY